MREHVHHILKIIPDKTGKDILTVIKSISRDPNALIFFFKNSFLTTKNWFKVSTTLITIKSSQNYKVQS